PARSMTGSLPAAPCPAKAWPAACCARPVLPCSARTNGKKLRRSWRPMLLEGTLQSWNDERGFGFIAPDGGGPQVFVHISAFQNPAARPQARQRLSYVLDKPAGDKPRASRARVLGASTPGASASQSPHAT